MSRIRTTGLVLLGLLGVLDIVGLAGFFVDGAPPVWVLLTGGFLGLVTVAGVGMALASRRGGLALAVASRIVSAVLGIGAFTDPAAPGWAKVVVAIAIALTIAGVGLVASGTRTPYRTVQSRP